MNIGYPKRIICLTEESVEIIFALGEGERIVGISSFTKRPEGLINKIPRVSTFIDANFKKIKSLEPDLILAFSDVQADIVKELTKCGYQVLVFNQRSD